MKAYRFGVFRRQQVRKVYARLLEWHKMAINHSLVNDLKFRPFICYTVVRTLIWFFSLTSNRHDTWRGQTKPSLPDLYSHSIYHSFLLCTAIHCRLHYAMKRICVCTYFFLFLRFLKHCRHIAQNSLPLSVFISFSASHFIAFIL